VARDAALGQISFACFIALCVALHPGFVLKSNEGGLSNYGVHAKTVLPYTLALGLAAIFSMRAARQCRQSELARPLEKLLLAYGVLTLLTLVTTYSYTRDSALKDLHVGVGVLITVFEFVSCLWIYRSVRRRRHFVYIAVVGFILAVLTFFGALHVLFLTQLLIGGSFAFLLIDFCRVATPSTNRDELN
jgi:hypothetical protein